MAEVRTRGTREKPEPPQCWACPATLPRGSKPERHGWASRPFAWGGTAKMRELFCGECYRRWGWGDGIGKH